MCQKIALARYECGRECEIENKPITKGSHALSNILTARNYNDSRVVSSSGSVKNDSVREGIDLGDENSVHFMAESMKVDMGKCLVCRQLFWVFHK